MIQVVVYTQSGETPTFLDIQKAPNISVNFSFADIREPDKRNSSYSHTFKVPFTQGNNQFFENIFEVNLTTTTFNPQKKAKATIMIDSVPQLTGTLQLKKIYTKSKLYELVIFGEGADLFHKIKDKKLIDAFRDIEDEVTLDTQWNHRINYTNIKASWTGTLVNSDTGATKSDILYPIVDYAAREDSDGNPQIYEASVSNGGINSSNYWDDQMIRATHLKPAIKIKTLIQQILIKAGFSYTSTFIDATYFGKLFMLLGTEGDELATQPIGGFKVGSTYAWGALANSYGTMRLNKTSDGTTNSIFYDVDEACYPQPVSLSNTEYNVTLAGNYKFGFRIKATAPSAPGAGTNDLIYIQFSLCVNGLPVANAPYLTYSTTASAYSVIHVGEFPGVDVVVGDKISMRVYNQSVTAAGSAMAVTFAGYVDAANPGSYLELLGTQTNKENSIVFVPDNMPDVTQADFLKDIIQRFNLVLVPNPETESNLIIEPFNDYLDAGSSKDWEDKLDTSKEVQIKFTNEFLNQRIEFKDLEDEDNTNKYHQETFGEVYGQYVEEIKDKDFAKEKTLTNNSIFSPFIPTPLGESSASGFNNFLIHKSFKYEDGQPKRITTKPKLFFYSGTPLQPSPLATYYIYDGVNDSMEAEYIYPYCSNFDSSPVTSSTKDLRWGGGYPYAFNTDTIGGVYTNENLYKVYWARYINELYSDEARMMEAYIHLTEIDILNFNFNDNIFINNSFWRINKIIDYQIGNNVSTKVELIKAITKSGAESSEDCLLEPSTIQQEGYVTFVQTTNGVATNPTQVCCEAFGYWWVESITAAAKRCRWIPPANVPPWKPNPPLIGGGVNTGNITYGSGNILKSMSMSDSFVLKSQNVFTKTQSGMVILTFTGKTDTADVTEIFIQGKTDKRFEIPPDTFCTLEATLNSVQTGLDNNNGSIGSSSYAVYKQAIKNVGGTTTMVGSLSRQSLIEDGDAGTRELTFTALNSTSKALQVKVNGNANMRISWSVDLKIEYNTFTINNTTAIWMDDNNIIFQDGDQMLWN